MAISLGDINFSLGADTAALQQSLNRLRSFGREVERVSRSQADGADKVAAQYRKQEAAMAAALQKSLNLNAAIRRNKGTEDMIKKVNDAFYLYANQLSNGTVKTLTFQRANERLAATLNTVKRELDDIKAKRHEETWGRLTTQMRALSDAAILVNGPLGGVASKISATGQLMRTLGTSTGLAVAGFAVATLGIYKFGEAVLANARKISVSESALLSLTNSQEETNRLLNEARGIAQRSGQAYTTVAVQYARFLAASQGTNLAGRESARIFETVSKVVGRLQLPAEQAEGVFRALEQMMSKGTIQAEELRGQLGDRLPGAFQIMARALGVSTQELDRMLKAGEVLSNDALPKLADELTRTFNIDGDVNNFQASINRVGNAWSFFLDEVDRTFAVSRAATVVLNATADVLEWLQQGVISLGETWTEFQVGFYTIVMEFGKAANTLVGFAKAIYDGFKGVFGRIGDIFAAFAKDLKTFIANPMSFGGFTNLSAALDKGFTGAFQEAFDKTLLDAKAFNDDLDALTRRYADEKSAKLAAQRAARAAALGVPQGLGSPTPPPGGGNGDGGAGSSRSANSLQQARLELDRLKQSINVLQTEGVRGMERLNAEFEKQDKIGAFADLLKESGLSAKQAAGMLGEYQQALEQFAVVDAAAKNTQAVIDELADAGGRAFDRFGQSITDMVSQGKIDLSSFSSVSKQIAGDILQTFLQLAVMNPLKNMIFGGSAPVLGGIGSIFGMASGGVIGPTGVQKMAKGGLLTSPTMIGTRSGPVMGGEAGTEAVMPLRRGSDGRLGVVNQGGGGRQIIQNITISTPNPASFKASEAQVSATLRRAVALGGRNS